MRRVLLAAAQAIGTGFIVATALAVSACSGINDSTLTLEARMTEAQVEAVLDGPPKRADLSNCGTTTAPLTCKGWDC